MTELNARVLGSGLILKVGQIVALYATHSQYLTIGTGQFTFVSPIIRKLQSKVSNMMTRLARSWWKGGLCARKLLSGPVLHAHDATQHCSRPAQTED